MLSSNDFAMLVYLRDNPQNAQADMFANFGNSAPARLKYLLRMEAIQPSLTKHADGSSVHTGFSLTSTGYMMLEDYMLEHRITSRAKWEDRAWKLAPIIISALALIVAVTSLAQSLHWIDIAR